MDEIIELCCITDKLKKIQGNFVSPFYEAFIHLVPECHFDVKLTKEKHLNTWNNMTKYEKNLLEEMIYE